MLIKLKFNCFIQFAYFELYLYIISYDIPNITRTVNG